MHNLDLALIGNCTIGALVDARATITWGCFPRFDGDPVFCALLKDSDDYGFFAVELADCERTEQYYLENTAILVTRLYDCHGGGLEVTDFAPRFGQYGRMFRPMMLVRRIRPVTMARAVLQQHGVVITSAMQRPHSPCALPPMPRSPRYCRKRHSFSTIP
jgi:hypothetical protein